MIFDKVEYGLEKVRSSSLRRLRMVLLKKVENGFKNGEYDSIHC